MAFDTILFFCVVGCDIYLVNDLQGSGGIELMTFAAELPITFFVDILSFRIIYVNQPGTMANKARKFTMQIIFKFFPDIRMAIIACFPGCMDWLHGSIINKSISAIMAVLSKCIWYKEMTNDQEQANENYKQGNESS